MNGLFGQLAHLWRCRGRAPRAIWHGRRALVARGRAQVEEVQARRVHPRRHLNRYVARRRRNLALYITYELSHPRCALRCEGRRGGRQERVSRDTGMTSSFTHHCSRARLCLAVMTGSVERWAYGMHGLPFIGRTRRRVLGRERRDPDGRVGHRCRAHREPEGPWCPAWSEHPCCE